MIFSKIIGRTLAGPCTIPLIINKIIRMILNFQESNGLFHFDVNDLKLIGGLQIVKLRI